MRTDPLLPEVTGGGPALFRLVRFWSRRWASGIAADGSAELPGETPGHVAHVVVLEAIDAAAVNGSALIGDVAVELGLDRSNASRMLGAAVSAGLVTKTVSAQDARRTDLAITPAGGQLLAAARAWQEQTFRQLVADWPAADARRFAAYLQRLAAQQGLDSPRQGGSR
jgi:DNA-binding MarR family transcriptional regulator